MPARRVEGPDGLALDRRDPPGDPSAVVLLSHSMMATRRSLDRPTGAGLASTLARAGLLVYTLDLPGHGDSPGGNWRYEDLVERAIPRAIRCVADRHPGLKLGYLGHSLAAHSGLAAFGRDPGLPIAAFVAIAGSVWMPRLAGTRRRRLYQRMLVESWGVVTRLLGHFPARRLGVGSADVSRAFVEACVRWTRRDRMLDATGVDLAAGMAGVRGPVLLVASQGDRTCPPDQVAAFGRFLPAAELEQWTVERGSHMGVVTDARSQPLWDRLARWSRERLRSA